MRPSVKQQRAKRDPPATVPCVPFVSTSCRAKIDPRSVDAALIRRAQMGSRRHLNSNAWSDPPSLG